MKIIIFLLAVSAFLQTTIIPLDLVLIILICRAYIVPQKENLFLAFIFGLLTAHLSLHNLGLQSLIYLVSVFLTQSFKKTRFSTLSFLIIPLVFTFLAISELIYSITYGQPFSLAPDIFFKSAVSLPVFYFIRMWEERFIVKKDIKLRF